MRAEAVSACTQSSKSKISSGHGGERGSARGICDGISIALGKPGVLRYADSHARRLCHLSAGAGLKLAAVAQAACAAGVPGPGPACSQARALVRIAMGHTQ